MIYRKYILSQFRVRIYPSPVRMYSRQLGCEVQRKGEWRNSTNNLWVPSFFPSQYFSLHTIFPLPFTIWVLVAGQFVYGWVRNWMWPIVRGVCRWESMFDWFFWLLDWVEYNSGSNWESSLSRFQITSTITPELFDVNFNYQLQNARLQSLSELFSKAISIKCVVSHCSLCHESGRSVGQ